MADEKRLAQVGTPEEAAAAGGSLTIGEENRLISPLIAFSVLMVHKNSKYGMNTRFTAWDVVHCAWDTATLSQMSGFYELTYTKIPVSKIITPERKDLNNLRAILSWLVFYINGAVKDKGKYTLEEWIYYFVKNIPIIQINQYYSVKECYNVLYDIGAQLKTNMSDKDFRTYFVMPMKPPPETATWLKVVRGITLSVSTFGIVMAVPGLLPAVISVALKLKDNVADAFTDFASTDNLVDLGTNIVKDNVSDLLNNTKNDIMKYVNELTTKSNINLSALTEYIRSDSNSLIKSVTNTIESNTHEILADIMNKKSATDLALSNPESMEAEVLRYNNSFIGKGFTDSLIDFLFPPKTPKKVVG